MKKIAFHSERLDVRGTCTSLFDYADKNETILKNKSLIVIPKKSFYENVNDEIAIKKFSNRFEIYYYDTFEELEEKIHDFDLLYVIKYGTNDGIFSKKIKTGIHCVFDMSEPHGDVYCAISDAIAQKYNKSLVVPHMVSLEPSKTKENLRKELNIPEDAVVFSRYGGLDTFNLPFVWKTIQKIIRDCDNIYFLFINTPCFYLHPQIKYLDKIITNEEKNKFICTSDAHIEASNFGHSFGLSIAEYSINNKPIICYNGWTWNVQHFKILKDKCLTFNDESSLYSILRYFKPIEWEIKDNNCYKEYLPEVVMKQFEKVFLN
jgi:hypothetical protein